MRRQIFAARAYKSVVQTDACAIGLAGYVELLQRVGGEGVAVAIAQIKREPC